MDQVALKAGALAGIPATIVSWGDLTDTLGEPDQFVVISYPEPQTVAGARVSRLLVCLSEVAPVGAVEFAA